MSGLAVDIERSPVAARLGWLLETTIERALTAEDIKREFALPPLVDPSSVIDRITGPWPIERVGSYEELSPTFARLHVTGADGQRRALRVGIDATSPHRIRYASRFHAPADVHVRDASETDAAALADLERRTPVIDAGVERRYNRADWFGQLRLMDEVAPRATAPRPLRARLDALVAEGVITRERADAYEVDQDRREADGRFQVTTLQYVVGARKPARRQPRSQALNRIPPWVDEAPR